MARHTGIRICALALLLGGGSFYACARTSEVVPTYSKPTKPDSDIFTSQSDPSADYALRAESAPRAARKKDAPPYVSEAWFPEPDPDYGPQECGFVGNLPNHCSYLVLNFRRNMSGYYPYDRRSGREVAWFDGVYSARGGMIWAAYRSNWSPIFKRDGDQLMIVDRRRRFRSTVPRFFNHSLAITRAYFALDSEHARLDLDLELAAESDVQVALLTSRAGLLPLRAGVTQRVAWPGSTPDFSGGQSLVALGPAGAVAEILRWGDWGLFRIIETADDIQRVDVNGAEVVRAVWHFRAPVRDLVILIRHHSPVSPFFAPNDEEGRFLSLFRTRDAWPPLTLRVSGEEPCRVLR